MVTRRKCFVKGGSAFARFCPNSALFARNFGCRKEKTAVSVRSGRYIFGLPVFRKKESH